MSQSRFAFEQLEYEFAKWVRLQNCVSCASGSAALCLALQTFNLPHGSEILCPELTMIACPRAIVMAGHIPIFVDCRSNLQINFRKIKERITPNTKAIMAVHLYGRKCNLDAIYSIATEFDLLVIEDRAEYHIPHDPLDPIPDAATYSFYSNKVIHGEEGGLIAFRQREHAIKARQLRCLGFTEAHDFLHVPGGFNWRLSNCHAELILESLRQVRANLSKRKAIESWYNQSIPKQWQLPKREGLWVYDLRVKGMGYGQQAEIVAKLNRQGIAARQCFKPMSMQPEFLGDFHSLKAYKLSREVFYLPIQVSMDRKRTQWIAERTVKAVNEVLTGNLPQVRS